MKPILIINKPHSVLTEGLEAHGIPFETDYTSSYDSIVSKLGDYDGIIIRSRISLDAHLLKHAHHIKFIAREGVGLDHIDTDYCARYGIPVLISPEGSKDTVGEHAIGMLLNLMNHLTRCSQQVKSDLWLREENRAYELKGKTVGIIGYGNMGQSFAKKISGFDVKTLAYDKYKSDYSDQYAEAVTLEDLKTRADIISVHIPLDKENQYFINESFFESLAKPVFFVNTARGLIVEIAALVHAIKKGKVLGAALDVLEYEDSSFDNLMNLEALRTENEAYRYLVESESVLLSPHIAGWSFESKYKHGAVLLKKILTLLEI
ncbi:MAG: NAD(P)-dependent oxidoreductase [Saprospiraceae bacterium]|nr:NAD(P)-dependent oxidoreductase [Saprospiraceae bacterium]